MKKLLVLLLFLAATIPSYAADVEYFASPDRPIEAVVTDEPCSNKVVEVYMAKYSMFPKNILEDVANSMKRMRVTKFFDEQVPLEGCVLPKDEDGEYALIDEKGREGYLIKEGLSQKPRPSQSKEI